MSSPAALPSAVVLDWATVAVPPNAPFDGFGRFQTLFVSRDTDLRNAPAVAKTLGIEADTPLPDLLARAWEAWGEVAADRLRGAFAFALLDSRGGDVVLARDVFGLAPLYMVNTTDRLIVGDTSRAVRERVSGALEIDASTIADFVAGRGTDHERTAYVGLKRFPAAHWGRATPGTTALTRYWDAFDIPPSKATGDVPGEFRQLFDASVRHACQAGPTTLFLSGGLDSSSIAASATAQGLLPSPLPCLAMVYDDTPGWADGPHLAEIADHVGARVRRYPSDAWNPLDDMDVWIAAMDGPVLPRGHSVSSRLLHTARDLGFNHVLSGHGGDEVVSQGFGRLNELARAGHWLALWREARGASQLYGDSRWSIVSPFLSHNRLVRRLRRKLGRTGRSDPGPADAGFVSEALRTRPITPPPQPRQRPDHDDRMLHAHALSSPIQALSLEIIAVCSRAAGVRTHMPFYDRDLVEFTLGLPSHWKLRGGQTRFVLREAMGERLPRGVRGRATKFDFSENFRRGLFSDPDRLLALTDPEATGISDYVDTARLQTLRDAVRRGRSDFPRPEIYFLWRCAVLGLWLAQVEAERADGTAARRVPMLAGVGPAGGGAP